MTDSERSSQRVLLVEDEIRLGESVRRGIGSHGHRVDLVLNCASAISAGLQRDYDVLVLDINLPDASGWDVLRALDRAGRRPRTVILSALPPSLARVREFAPLAVLEKPFPIDALHRLIEQPAPMRDAEILVTEGSHAR
jgi:DNA-binding response OmpR family regulator